MVDIDRRDQTLQEALDTGRIDTDAPFHKDESVRIGRIVHATMGFGCASARVVGHPEGQPNEDSVYLAIDYPPGKDDEGQAWNRWRMWRPASPADRPSLTTWHWPRACPFNR